jgi:hypothetical protein
MQLRPTPQSAGALDIHELLSGLVAYVHPGRVLHACPNQRIGQEIALSSPTPQTGEQRGQLVGPQRHHRPLHNPLIDKAAGAC